MRLTTKYLLFATPRPMNKWIYLSKKGQDEYIARLARGAGQDPVPIETWRYEDEPQTGIVLRGIMKHKIMKRCREDGRQFRFVDSGYFGNRPSARNPNGWKWYHRIVPNDLQHDAIIPRPADRWQALGLTLEPRRRTGSRILVAVPDQKACEVYDTTVDQWLAMTLGALRANSDREIVIRQRTANPDARLRDPHTSFAAALADDVHAVVTFNSVAATESVMAGVPVFVTAPCNAARPVANLDLARINDPWYPDPDLVHAWVCHLAYGQFHNSELTNGTALRILDETLA